MTGVTLRRMQTEDIAFGMRLKEIAGWNQTAEDWGRFLAFEPEGCFVALWEGEPAGTVTTVRYGSRFGWVGMVLVLPECRRRGIGTTLLNAGIEYLSVAGVETVKLDATPEGKYVYDRLAFREEYRLDRWQGVCREVSWDGVRQAEPEDLDRIMAIDESAFGADRRRVLLEMMRGRAGGVLVTEAGPSTGYAVTRPGSRAWQVGPVVADDPEAGVNLLRAAFGGLEGRESYVDMIRSNIDAVCVAERQGFVVQREFIRMYRGPNGYPGSPDRQFAVSGPEKG